MERYRLDSLPKRVEWAEVGSVTLPRFVFTWLETSRKQAWTVADLGMLVAMLGMFENQVSLFPNAVFEIEDGEPVLVVQGALDDLRFSRNQNGHPTDSFDSGYVREREALRTLVRNNWFTATREGGQLKIRLGDRAKEIRKGGNRRLRTRRSTVLLVGSRAPEATAVPKLHHDQRVKAPTCCSPRSRSPHRRVSHESALWSR